MQDWLVTHGVPRDKVVRDHAGFDTHDSCVRAHDVFGVRDAVVVTQDYHLRRALFSCSLAGIDVVGVGVSSTSVQPEAGRALAAARGARVVARRLGRRHRAARGLSRTDRDVGAGRLQAP